jgi:cyclase
MIPRIIPSLLYSEGGLYKTVAYKNRDYLGDPINTIRLYNSMEVDELVILDIDATRSGKEPDYEALKAIAEEAFFPITYGGGIRTLHQTKKIIGCGFEKVCLTSTCFANEELLKSIAEVFGSQSVVAKLDVQKKLFGYRLYNHVTAKNHPGDIAEAALLLQQLGAGEIILNSVDRDGTMSGFDCELVRSVAKAVTIPLVASGGAGRLEHFAEVIGAGASAACGGSIFVYAGIGQGVLINYPQRCAVAKIFASGK